MQSVEVVSFGGTLPAAYPGPGSDYTTLFSAMARLPVGLIVIPK
jgi:hypothetical protein